MTPKEMGWFILCGLVLLGLLIAFVAHEIEERRYHRRLRAVARKEFDVFMRLRKKDGEK